MSTGARPPYPPFPQAGGISGGQSTTPYPVNQPNFSAVNPQSSYRPRAGYLPPSTSTGANVVTSNPVSTSSSSNDDAAVKASLRTAVEDKIRRRTKALFGQAQVSTGFSSSFGVDGYDLKVFKRVLIKFWSRRLRFKSRRLGNRVPVSLSSISWKSGRLNTQSSRFFSRPPAVNENPVSSGF